MRNSGLSGLRGLSVDHKEFLSELKAELETRIDGYLIKRKAIIERRGAFAELMKPGLAKIWRAQYEAQPQKYKEKNVTDAE